MSKKVYEVWFVIQVGRCFVEAESEPEALNIAEHVPNYEEINDTDEAFPMFANVVDDEVLEILKPKIHK